MTAEESGKPRDDVRKLVNRTTLRFYKATWVYLAYAWERALDSIDVINRLANNDAKFKNLTNPVAAYLEHLKNIFGNDESLERIVWLKKHGKDIGLTEDGFLEFANFYDLTDVVSKTILDLDGSDVGAKIPTDVRGNFQKLFGMDARKADG